MGPRCVNGIADGNEIAKQFAQHFATVCTNNSNCRAAELKSNYMQMRAGYCGRLDDARYCFDVELCNFQYETWQSTGLDGITAEHLRFSHYSLSCILSKLYNFMLRLAYVPHCLVYPTLSL